MCTRSAGRFQKISKLLLLFAFKVNCALNVHGGASYTFGALTILVLLPMRTYSVTSSLPEACRSLPAIPPGPWRSSVR